MFKSDKSLRDKKKKHNKQQKNKNNVFMFYAIDCS